MQLRNLIKNAALTAALVLCTTPALASSGQQVVDGNWQPAGCLQITNLSAVVGLGSIPSGARFVLVQAEAQNVRWRDDGTDPTAAIGMVIEAGQTLVYNGNLASLEMIEAAASAIVNVCFYR
jgi:hypothetical protein